MVDVVVVDDDFMVRAIHESYVSEVAGYDVVGLAGSGREALAVIDRTRPDLVLLDVHLPDMTGIQVLHELRRAGNNVDVVIVTAERHVDFVRSALKGGASQYLVKPFSAEELQSRLVALARAGGEDGRRQDGPAVDQETIDRMFQLPEAAVREDDSLPKGLSPASLDLIRQALVDHGEQSASDCATYTGMARVSTRRYLEYLVQVGDAHMRLRYGGGRPVKLFRVADGAAAGS